MKQLWALIVGLLVAVAPLGAMPAPATAADCQFVLGFLTLQQMIPTQVGNCLANVQYNPANGDALQPTTGPTGQGGLLVWRKFDNFTAFTDGFRTWINGPFGPQVRLNSQRFAWEFNPDLLPIVPPPVAGERCHTGVLSIALQGVDAGAGNFVGSFTLKNNSGVPCTFFGFVGAQLLDAQNNALPTNVVRGGGSLSNLPGPSLVAVPAGGSATFKMHWEDVPVGGETSCPTASQLKVTPPDEFDALLIATKITACGGGRLDVSAIVPVGDVSRNWSGYAAVGGIFTSVTGTWVVSAPRTTVGLSSSATWVGIGGVMDRDLIQAGTEDVRSGPGAVEYDAWLELLPAPPQAVPLAVKPGDSVTVSITEQGAGNWSIAMRNNTSGQRFQTTVAYASSRSSAEWIEEAPSTRRRVLPLDDFGTVQFSGGSTVKDGKTLTIAQAGAQPITLIDIAGNAISTPSGLTADGQGFNVIRTGVGR